MTDPRLTQEQIADLAKVVYGVMPNYDNDDNFIPWESLHPGSVERGLCIEIVNKLLSHLRSMTLTEEELKCLNDVIGFAADDGMWNTAKILRALRDRLTGAKP